MIDQIDRSIDWSCADHHHVTSPDFSPIDYRHCSELGRIVLNTRFPVNRFTLKFAYSSRDAKAPRGMYVSRIILPVRFSLVHLIMM